MPPRPCADRYSVSLVLAVWLSAATAAVAGGAEFGPPRLLRPAPQQPAAAMFLMAGLTPFEPVGVSGRVRRSLLQYEALAADGAWDEAIELIERLQTEAGAELTSVTDANAQLQYPEGHERYVPIADRCQQLLSALPAEGLTTYRGRVDRSARQRLDDAASRRDTAQLERLVRELQASEPAADALLALGELALERSDYAASRRWHARLHPLLWDPLGRPAASTLVLIAAAADPAGLAAAWSDAKRPAGLPLAPADDDLLPLALSRLALTSIREGDLRRATAETRLLRALAPEAAGRLAGRIQPLAPALDAMIQAGGGAGRSLENPSENPSQGLGAVAWAWADSVTVEQESPVQRFAPQTGVFQLNALGQFVAAPTPASPPEADAPPSLRAAVEGTAAYYVEKNRLMRLDLTTGATQRHSLPGVVEPRSRGPQPAPGDVTTAEAIRQRLAAANGAIGFVQVPQGNDARQNLAPSPVSVDSRLTIADGVLYVRVVEALTPTRFPDGMVAARSKEDLLGVPIGAEDKAPVRFSPPAEEAAAVGQGGVGFQFASSPTVVGDRLYVAIARPGMRTEIAAACYATASGRLLWKTDLGSGDTVERMAGANASAPVVAGDTLYLSTNLGAVATLDAVSGRLRWLARYPRDAQPITRFGVATPEETRCVVVGDQVIAAPSDSRRLFAWDTTTGAPLWDADPPADARLVGATPSDSGAIVVLAGRQLAGYDALTGQRRLLWPESPRSGVRGLGDAAILGGVVYWPTRGALLAIDPATGGLTHSPLDLAPVGSAGANVIATDYGLLVCGPDRLRLLARVEAMAPPEPPEPVSRLTETDSEDLAQQ